MVLIKKVRVISKRVIVIPSFSGNLVVVGGGKVIKVRADYEL